MHYYIPFLFLFFVCVCMRIHVCICNCAFVCVRVCVCARVSTQGFKYIKYLCGTCYDRYNYLMNIMGNIC